MLITSRNVSYKVFPAEYVFIATSCKCLCFHFGHMNKIKTSLNRLLRIIEHNNRFPDHLFFYRLCYNDTHSKNDTEKLFYSIQYKK